MLLEELDGFLAGILVCPEVIPPSEWLPVVWGQTEGENNPRFDNLAHMNKVLTLVMEHCNTIAKKLFEELDRYAPLFAADSRNGNILWEIWIEGFEKAVKLRPTVWQLLLDADLATTKAMSGPLMLPDVARRDPSIPKAECNALASITHERIGDWILTVNEWRLENYNSKQGKSMPPPAINGSPGKVGRNDPCPLSWSSKPGSFQLDLAWRNR